MDVCLIKLGGSFITDKSQPNTLRLDHIELFAQDLSDLLQVLPQLRIVLVNGNGSIGHPVAQQYAITAHPDRCDGCWDSHEQIQDKIPDHPTHQHRPDQLPTQSALGFCILQKTVAQLNRTVVDTLLAHQLAAVSIQPSSLFWKAQGTYCHLDLRLVGDLLDRNIIPAFYGDPVLDRDHGFTVISSDTLLNQLARYLMGHPHYAVKQVINVGHYDGVLDSNGSVIPEIHQGNYAEIKPCLGESAQIDISGGMAHKVQELLDLAQLGCPSWIIDGTVPNNLKTLVLTGQASGTLVR